MDGMASPSQSSGSFYTPLLISFAGIVSTSLLIAAYHFILVRYCLRRRRRRELAERRLRQAAGVQSGEGVCKEVLSTIPILSYSTGDVIAGELFRVDQSECVVCLGELEEGDMVRLLPNCSHAFHLPCIDQWFLKHSNCPVCRSPVTAPSTSVKPSSTSAEDLQVSQSPFQFRGQGDDDAINVNASTTQSVIKGLKRSFSMGQSYTIINLQGEREKALSAASSSLSSSSINGIFQSKTNRVRSVRQLDRMSSRPIRSFSQLSMGRGGSTAKWILPY